MNDGPFRPLSLLATLRFVNQPALVRIVMEFGLTERQRKQIDDTRRFAQATLSLKARPRDLSRAFSRDLWDEASAVGLAGLPIPEKWGGRDLDTLDVVLTIEALSKGCEDGGLIFSLCAHMCACEIPISQCGTPDQKEHWLRALATGKVVGAGAITEPDAGSDAFAMQATAVKQGGGYLLNGQKCFVTNAPIADVFLVYAKTDPNLGSFGITPFLVPRGTTGMTVEEGPGKMGLATAPWGTLKFFNCALPLSARLGSEGAGAAVFHHSMGWERLCVLAIAIGAMERTLDRCLAHVRTRRQFGTPIGTFQSVANKVVDMKLRLETSRLLIHRASWMHRENIPCDEMISLAKLHVSECAVESGLDAVQLFGATGISPEVGIDLLLRDALPLRIVSGTSELQRQIVARLMGIQ